MTSEPENRLAGSEMKAPVVESARGVRGWLSAPGDVVPRNRRRWGVVRLTTFFGIAALTAIGLHCTIGFGLRRVRTSGTGAFNAAMQGRVNAQVVISGSSRAFVQYDPREIQNATGISAFNLGRNGSHTDVQLAVLKTYLNHNVKPDLVIQNLDLHTFELTPSNEIFEPAEYVPYLHNPDIYQALVRINPEVWKWKFLPLHGYVVPDMRLTWLSGIRALVGQQPREDCILGYNPRDSQWTVDFARFVTANPAGRHATIDKDGINILEELIKVCQEREIKVILVYAPEYLEMQRFTVNRGEVFAGFTELARRYHVPFWDYSDWQGCGQQDYFYNSQHLNRQGSVAFSANLAGRVKSLLGARPGSQRESGTPSVKP